MMKGLLDVLERLNTIFNLPNRMAVVQVLIL